MRDSCGGKINNINNHLRKERDQNGDDFPKISLLVCCKRIHPQPNKAPDTGLVINIASVSGPWCVFLTRNHLLFLFYIQPTHNLIYILSNNSNND